MIDLDGEGNGAPFKYFEVNNQAFKEDFQIVDNLGELETWWCWYLEVVYPTLLSPSCFFFHETTMIRNNASVYSQEKS